MKISFTFLFISLILSLNSCKDKSQNPDVAVFDFCSSDCAIDSDKYYGYDTVSGKVEYTIPYPEKATLVEVSAKDNIITYECSGGDYTSKNLEYLPVKKTGMSKDPNSTVTVIVIFLGYGCNNEVVIKKKKESEIQGSPITLKCKSS